MSKSKTATAPAPEAAQTADVVTEAPEVESDGIFRPKTTKELFAHDRAERKKLMTPPEPEPTPSSEAPAVAPEVAPEVSPVEEPKTDVPPTPLEAFKKLGLDPATKVKVIIDGEEREVTAEDLIKGYQTDQHLSKRGNKISAERQELERIRAELRQELSKAKPGYTAPATEDTTPTDDPFVLQLRNEIAELRGIKDSLAPVLYDRAREAVAEELKAEGFDDFKTYLPRIATFVATVEDQRQFDYYNTPEGAKALYFRFMAEDARKQASKPAPAAIQKPVMERPRPPIVRIPSSSSSGIAVSDDSEEKYAAALKRYQESGNKDKRAWEELMKIRGLA